MTVAQSAMKLDAGALHATVTKRGGLRARVLFWHGPSSLKARAVGDWRDDEDYTLASGDPTASARAKASAKQSKAKTDQKIKQRG